MNHTPPTSIGLSLPAFWTSYESASLIQGETGVEDDKFEVSIGTAGPCLEWLFFLGETAAVSAIFVWLFARRLLFVIIGYPSADPGSSNKFIGTYNHELMHSNQLTKYKFQVQCISSSTCSHTIIADTAAISPRKNNHSGHGQCGKSSKFTDVRIYQNGFLNIWTIQNLWTFVYIKTGF